MSTDKSTAPIYNVSPETLGEITRCKSVEEHIARKWKALEAMDLGHLAVCHMDQRRGQTMKSTAACLHDFDDVDPEPGKPWLGICRKCGKKVKLAGVPCVT
jgi:hypothetical protein